MPDYPEAREEEGTDIIFYLLSDILPLLDENILLQSPQQGSEENGNSKIIYLKWFMKNNLGI